MDSGLAHRAPRNDSGASGRLTSDPSRTSLGLLPSGPDPVGEWLVHRQSPGPYLGPKAPESKRRGGGIRQGARGRGRSNDPALPGVFVAPSRSRPLGIVPPNL